MCRRKHTGRRDIGASQRRGDKPALRAAAPTQRGLRTLQPAARALRRAGTYYALVIILHCTGRYSSNPYINPWIHRIHMGAGCAVQRKIWPAIFLFSFPNAKRLSLILTSKQKKAQPARQPASQPVVNINNLRRCGCASCAGCVLPGEWRF